MDIGNAIRITETLLKTKSKTVSIPKEILKILLQDTSSYRAQQKLLENSKKRKSIHTNKKPKIKVQSIKEVKLLQSACYFEEYPYKYTSYSRWYYTQAKIDWRDL